MEEVRVGLETREAHDWLALWGQLTHDSCIPLSVVVIPGTPSIHGYRYS